MKWTLEDNVDDYVKECLEKLGLKKLENYNVESSMSDYMKEALKGSSKTKNKTNFGKPDFHIEKYRVPVIFENKLGKEKLVAKIKGEIKEDEKSISNFAVNGALYYATQMVASDKYDEVIAIGVAGNNKEDTEIQVYYVYGSSMKSIKLMSSYKTLDFLENERSFSYFYNDAILTEKEKHELLITSKKILNEYACRLNRLMHNHNITATQRVLYVSGMLLSMQDVMNEGVKIQDGLTPKDLKGIQTDSKRDGIIITQQIEEFLKTKNMEPDKMKLMLSSFSEISKDRQRDEPESLDKEISKLLKEKSSTNKQIFTFIYEYVFKQIDSIAGHVDIIGEMYSEFLKYALGDGKELGIVLTPPYVTKMMAEILNITDENHVMDLATGSAGFLISSMQLMIANAQKKYGKDTTRVKAKIDEIKKRKLLGVELNAEMYTLAATNMILRGDGSSNIQKGNSFNQPEKLYSTFKADRVLLNPPFSFKENGLPFIAFALDKMEKGGLGAIIIQDSAGSGKAKKTTIEILKKHTLLASIKMPVDLFIPMAGVQTSIYIFEAGSPHDMEKPVKFIDFRNDGYKRTKRGLTELNNPTQKYQDIIKIFKSGKLAKVDATLWNLDEIYIEDFINDSGQDWNFEHHKKIDNEAKLQDFNETISNHLAWETFHILKKEGTSLEKNVTPILLQYEKDFLNSGGKWQKIEIQELFDIISGHQPDIHNRFNKKECGMVNTITGATSNNGICFYSYSENYLKDELTIAKDGEYAGTVFLQTESFIIGGHCLGIIAKEKMSNNVKLYIASLINKVKEIWKGYDRPSVSIAKLKTLKISLPFINDKICFSYIEKYIEALQLERISELELYLKVIGLKKDDDNRKN